MNSQYTNIIGKIAHIVIWSTLFICNFNTSLKAMMGPMLAPQDPLERLNYRSAFNLDAIHREYSTLMIEMGCDENVFEQRRITTGLVEASNLRFAEGREPLFISSGDLEASLLSAPNSPFHNMTEHTEGSSILTERSINTEKKRLYEEACLKKLKNERRSTILEPAKEASALLLLMGGAAGGVVAAVGTNSFGGSFSIFAVMFNSIWFVRDIIRSGFNLCDPPPHDLDELETKFSVNQCYIPKALWPIITEKFITARRNPFEHQSTVNYIEFSLGLTIYAPKPPLRLEGRIDPANEAAVDMLLWDLTKRTNKFFEDYDEAFKGNPQLHTLKTNMRKFVLSILGKQGESPRYLYLCGPGGIGKTHFARVLVEWIKEKLPNSVRYESLDINSPEELEGNDKRPGVFLNILRNQCTEKKRGSVVVMDEASFLNNPDFMSTSKRVFNGTFSQLNTTYFGAGVDGTGIILNVPPVLLLATNNEEITDSALKSRFDVINFPSPKPESLFNYSKRLISLDSLSRKIPGLLASIQGTSDLLGTLTAVSGRGEENYIEELKLAVNKLRSFRDVQATIPILLNNWYEKHRGI